VRLPQISRLDHARFILARKLLHLILVLPRLRASAVSVVVAVVLSGGRRGGSRDDDDAKSRSRPPPSSPDDDGARRRRRAPSLLFPRQQKQRRRRNRRRSRRTSGGGARRRVAAAKSHLLRFLSASVDVCVYPRKSTSTRVCDEKRKKQRQNVVFFPVLYSRSVLTRRGRVE